MLIDKKVLAGLIEELGPEVLASLISIYIEDTNNTITKLKNALKENDFAAIALESHTLKSVSATYGATDALVLAKAIDASCKNKMSVTSMADDIEKLIVVLGDTIIELQNLDANAL
jgi:HPt (histidine-containing phosphotransfer) domain-containing protein